VNVVLAEVVDFDIVDEEVEVVFEAGVAFEEHDFEFEGGGAVIGVGERVDGVGGEEVGEAGEV